MTKEELTALRRERGKQELNIGDRVKVYDRNGDVMYGGKTAIIIEKALLDPTEFYYGLYVEGVTLNKFSGKGLLCLNTAIKVGKTALLAPFYAEDLELVKEPTDEIKVGDRVEVIYQSGNRRGMVCEVKYDGAVDVDFGGGCLGHDIVQDRIIKLDCPKKQSDNTITIPVKADLDDTYWDAYRAELVKEIAVKVANNTTINDSMIAYQIISFATQIVDNLKKQSE